MTGTGGASPRKVRSLVYGDVNMNIIDGSAIWAQSTVDALARAGHDVLFLLKAKVETSRLLDPLRDRPGVQIVRPDEKGLAEHARGGMLTPNQASAAMTRIDAAHRLDVVVVRGMRVVRQVVADGRFAGRLWVYLTDIPQHVGDLTAESMAELARIATAARFLLCQTEELRGFLESTVPATCGKSVVYPPAVPEPEFDPPAREPLDGRPVRLVYTGKFAPRWNTLQMCALPSELAARGVPTEMHMVGDKIHQDPAHSEFHDRMRAALSDSAGVIWHGGVPRQAAMQIAAGADFGIGWRHPSLDASLELSTKVLEFGILGLPVILNRTPMHEGLLGADYPLFVTDWRDLLNVVERAALDPEMRAFAAERARMAVVSHTMAAAAGRLRALTARAFPSVPALAGRTRRLRVGVAGHDLKFVGRMLEYLQSLPELEVRVDHWSALAVHDPAVSSEMLEWAEVVVAEWCGPVAVWYSHRKRPGQRLIVRLHRFELYGPWPAEVDIDNIDQVVCVSPHYGELTREKTGWPAHKIVVVPNWVDVEQFERPKLVGSQYHLGFIGIAPMRKRLDLALDVLERLRRRDRRFRLFAKTKMTWDYSWIWAKPEERAHLDDVLRRAQASEWLRGAVVFDQFGPDVAAWLRKVGFVLSTSDDESFHLAPAEGMASGAVPVIRDWPGADMIYDRRWIQGSADGMAEHIHELVVTGRWDAERREAVRQVRAAFDLPSVCATWVRLLTGNLPAATDPSSVELATARGR